MSKNIYQLIETTDDSLILSKWITHMEDSFRYWARSLAHPSNDIEKCIEIYKQHGPSRFSGVGSHQRQHYEWIERYEKSYRLAVSKNIKLQA